MKKILSLAMAGVMMFSALPMAYAADVDYKTGTNVTVVGDGGEYFVTVPASLEPGQTGTVRAYGKWASNETVKVTTDATVEVEHQETGAKTNVNVTFAGIESLGNDLEDMDVTANISIDKGDIRFGEWKGVIEYNVEFDDGATLQTFTIDGTEYQAKEGMTWAEWIESEYNTIGAWLPDIGAPVSVTIDGQNYTVTYVKPEGGSSSFNDYHEVLKYTEYSLTARSY